MTQIQKYNEEIGRELADPGTMRALMVTTFKGISDEKQIRQAMLEGYIRGFTLKDFLEKNIYAIPYGGGYSLVTSIDYARKVGMKSGVVGVEAPIYEDREGKLNSCTITVKRRIGDDIGQFTATAFFDEFNTNRNQWATKPKHMLAKVAEMHALRKACPEELSQAYAEEEMNGGVIDSLDTDTQAEINNIRTIHELTDYYKANQGKGKAFDKAIQARKKELESENLSDDRVSPTESQVVSDPEA